MVSWKKSAEIATVLGFFAVTIALGINIKTLGDTEQQLQQSTSTLNALTQLILQNNDLLKNQNKLVELQIQQLTLVKETINQTEEKTIRDTYFAEGDHFVDIENCTYDYQSKTISYNVAVLTDKQKPSLVPFFVNMDLSYYAEDNNHQNVARGWIPAVIRVLQPTSFNWFTGVPIYQILQENNRTNEYKLFIQTQYLFAPYSNVENMVILNPTRETAGQLLIGFEKDQNGVWQTLNDIPNIRCK